MYDVNSELPEIDHSVLPNSTFSLEKPINVFIANVLLYPRIIVISIKASAVFSLFIFHIAI